jgi:hypothetical protein
MPGVPVRSGVPSLGAGSCNFHNDMVAIFDDLTTARPVEEESQREPT